jgi:hypothetical protein
LPVIGDPDKHPVRELVPVELAVVDPFVFAVPEFEDGYVSEFPVGF